MSDYGFAHEGKVYTPNATPAIDVADNDARNKAIEANELKRWEGRPDVFLAYYAFPAESSRPGVHTYRETFYPLLSDATVKTWLGTIVGTITNARVYRHNFGSRMVSIRVKGTNGARYAGRASYDWGECIRLHRVK